MSTILILTLLWPVMLTNSQTARNSESKGVLLVSLNGDRQVALINPTTQQVTVSGDSQRAFVSHPAADRVSVINLRSRTIEHTFVVGKQPDGVAWVG